MIVEKDLDFIKDYVNSEFLNTKNNEGLYKGFKFSYNLSAFSRGDFVIHLEKDKIAINLPFNMSDNPSGCSIFAKGLIDFIVAQTENSVNKIVNEIKKLNSQSQKIYSEPVYTKDDYNEEDDDFNCFSHLAEDLENSDEKEIKQESNSSSDLKDWFNNTDTTRFLK